jgi:hypothetical protein
VTNGTRAYEVDKRLVRDSALTVLGPQIGLVPHSVEDAESVFRRSSLPREMHIDRNPFDTDFSIWFLLVDLWDVKKLITRMFSPKNGKPIDELRLRHLASYGSKLGPKTTASQLHNLNLFSQFGLIPTIRDIREFATTIHTWKSKYDNVSDVVKRRFRYHLKNDISSLFPPVVQEEEFVIPFSSTAGLPVRIKMEQKSKADWHGMALYGFACPEFQGWLTRLKQICDSFGVLDPSAIWDVIPFTFVVDWFCGIGSWLHANRPILFPATPTLYDYLESVKITTTRTYTATLNEPRNTFPYFATVTHPIWLDEYTTYIRHRFQPMPGYITMDSGSNTNRSLFNWRRVGISASLIAQRIPR